MGTKSEMRTMTEMKGISTTQTQSLMLKASSLVFKPHLHLQNSISFKGGKRVPEYDFECGGCGEVVSIRATMKEKQDRLKCPLCGSEDLAQIFSPIGHLSGCEGSPTSAPG